jgi:prepilin-type processing-associated H-X9-DG protein
MSCFALQACVKVGRFAENALKSAGNGTFHICAQEQYRNCANAGRPPRGKTSVDGRLFSGHIIAILAAILFPVFARAREKARQTSCLSNVKQITLAVNMYATDYDEILPWLYSKDISAGRVGVMQQTMPYIRNADVFNCPSASHKTDVNSYQGHRSYAYNFNMMDFYSARKLALIRRPSEIVLMGDACCVLSGTFNLLPPERFGPFECDPDGTNCKVCGGTHNSLYPEPMSGPTGSHSSEWEFPGFNFLERHNGTGNAGFVDGHAKAMKHSELYNNRNDHPYFDWDA